MDQTERERAWARAAFLEPLDWSARHDPVEPVEVTIDAGRRKTRVLTQQRTQDRRVTDAVDAAPLGSRAAAWIATGFRVTAEGMMPHVARIYGHTPPETDAERTDPGSVQDFLIAAERAYRDWQTSATANNVRAAAVLDVVVWGASLSSVDALYRKRKGWGRSNLQRGLVLFAGVQCWLGVRDLEPFGLTPASCHGPIGRARQMQQTVASGKQTA